MEQYTLELTGVVFILIELIILLRILIGANVKKERRKLEEKNIVKKLKRSIHLEL